MSDNSEIAKTFLSHNSHDKPAVEVIKGLLERGDIQRGERAIPCWFDKDDLRSQGTWMSQLEEAVAACGAAVVFFGPDGHGPVHKYEIDLLLKRAMYEQGRDAIRLVLVLLPGAQESAIQGFISLHMWADFRKGLDDAAALQRLRAFILGEAPTSGPGDDPLIPKPEIEPYRGLEAFEGKHASYFFGRDNEIKELCGRLHEWPFTAVIGGSGSGKSSVVRAGLQTDLAKKERPTLAHTTTITVRPGTNPIHALAEQIAASQSEQSAAERLKFVDDLDTRFRSRPDALLNTLTSLFVRDDQHVLLVIDQFEELFTHSTETQQEKREGEAPAEPRASDSQQTQFVELLAAVAKSQLDRLRIVITLRADFFDRCLSLPTLKSLIENRTLLLGKLSDDALRTVIEAPAFQVGAYFEKGLVARILKDVENQNGSLPLLQHALKELWEQRRFGFLTDDAYDATGGGEGVLKKSTDQPVQAALNFKRNFFQRIKDRLWGYDFFISYQWSSGGQYAVNLAQRLRDKHYDVFLDRSDYATGDDWKVMGAIALRNTQRLVLIATKGAVTNSKPVEREVEIFTDRGRRVIPIIFGEELKSLDRTQYPTYGRMPESQLYIAEDPACLNSAPSDETLDRLFQMHSVLRRRNLRSIITAIPAILVIIFAVSALYAAIRARSAEGTAKEAAKGEKAAKDGAQKQQADASRENADFYWRFAIEARDANEPVKAAHLFLRGASSLARIAPVLKTDTDTKGIVTDGLAATAVDQPLIRRWVHDAAVVGSQFSPDESRVLTWSGDAYTNKGEAWLWDVTKPEAVRTFKHDGFVYGAQFGRDESCVLTWSADDTARLWDATKPEAVRTFKHDGFVYGARFSRNESLVLTWSADGTARLWDVTKSEAVQTFKHDGPVNGAHFSRDESRVLTWGDDNTARLWDVTKSVAILILTHDFGVVTGAQFSRDETRVLTWSTDFRRHQGEVRLWDVTKPEAVQTLKHDSDVNGAQFSRDASRVLTWCADGTVRLWDANKSETVQNFKHDRDVNGAQFSRDESRVLTWSADGTARLWDVTTSEAVQTFKHHDRVDGVIFSRDESRVLTWSADGTARLWDVTKSEAVQTFKHDGPVNGAHFSRDESRVLTWGDDNTARLWDTTKFEAVQTFKHDSFVTGAQFGRDESRLLSWSADKTARLWDVTKHEAVQTFRHDGPLNGARFSCDDSRVLSWNGSFFLNKNKCEARLWNLKTEEILTFEHDNDVNGAQFSRDESRVLTWCADGAARLWDVTKPEAVQTFKHDGPVNGAQFSRDESRVLTWCRYTAGEYNGEARLWDVNKSEVVQAFKHDLVVNGAPFSRDESRVLTWSGSTNNANKGEAQLWEVTKSEAVQTFKHDGPVNGAHLSRDESRVLTWSADGTARLWDVTKPEAVRTFKHDGILNGVNGAQFSRDESRVLTWSADGMARLWDVTKPEAVHTFKHDGIVNGAQFNRDESRVLTWSNDTTARLWDLTDPLKDLQPAERILELEVRSGTTLDAVQNLRTLKFDEWQKRVTSPEYQAIERKLPPRSAKLAPQAQATNRQPTVDTPDSSSKR